MTHNYRVFKLLEVDSTNVWAKAAYNNKLISAGAAIVAETQTAGRGQLRTKWHDEAGKNLLFTLVVDVNYLSAASFFRLNEAASLALIDVLGKLVPATIKWPNDISANQKKLAGILIETIIQGTQIKTAFIGIGLNVNQLLFPAELKATSLALEAGFEFDLPKLFDEILSALQFRIAEIQQPNVLGQHYFEHLLGTKTPLKYQDAAGTFFATVQKIEDDGRLVLRVNGEPLLRKYRFKEVSLLLED